jgi:hypothetical protein
LACRSASDAQDADFDQVLGVNTSGFGLRAAKRAGLSAAPVMIAAVAFEACSQVAENLKRQSLSPLDLARIIRS